MILLWSEFEIILKLFVLQKPDEDDQCTGETDSDPLRALEQQDDLAQDYNGDSGYEAESRRGVEDDILMDNDILTPSPGEDRMYMYDISSFDDTGTPLPVPTYMSTPMSGTADHHTQML